MVECYWMDVDYLLVILVTIDTCDTETPHFPVSWILSANSTCDRPVINAINYQSQSVLS